MPTIALVDDDRNILTSVSIALEGEGYRVQTYTDGAQALDGLRANPPDLAIFDIKMPRMDGMELLRRLRQKSDIPVIFLTSKDEEIDELKSLEWAANGGATDWDGIERELASWIDRLRIDICNAIYRDLRDEYDYLCSEEAAMEAAEANEWEFDENGDFARG